MELNFLEFKKEEANLLYDFLKSEIWNFHSGDPNKLTQEYVINNVENNYYTEPENKSFWITNQDNDKIGFLTIEELEDSSPSFDLRIASKYRGNGIGEQTLKWMTDYVFTNYPDKIRFEACTREDNIAMRKVFKKCGYVKEGHIRKAWPPPGSKNHKEYYDSIRYGIIRSDWENNTVTQLNWDDENF